MTSVLVFVRHSDETHFLIGTQFLIRLCVNLYTFELELCFAAIAIPACIDRLPAYFTEQSTGAIVFEIEPLFMNPAVELLDRDASIQGCLLDA